MIDVLARIAELHRSGGNCWSPEHWRQVENLTNAALREFAALNEWRETKSIFGPEDIGRRTHGRQQLLSDNVFDHVHFFKRDRRNAAIVTQPYFDASKEAAEMANDAGIAFHVARIPKASFHYPGATYFFVFAERDHKMRWLPEQMVRP
jgi:hypothetical protein